jgi:hypothetical protein
MGSMERISLELDGDHFALRREGVTVAELSFEDVLAFGNIAPSYRQFVMSRLYPDPGAIYSTPASDTGATWDALGVNVLLQIKSGNGSSIFELDLQRFETLRDQLNTLSEHPPSFQSRQ